MVLRAILILAAVASVNVQASTPEGDREAGARKNAMCVGCHGIVGFKTGFPEVYRVPKLYGQNAGYIVAALKAYKSGERSHPSMRAIAEALTEQDMADLGAYFESAGHELPRQRGGRSSADAEPGKSLVTRGGCPACHGENFSEPIDGTYPKLAGQNSDYLYVALRAYKGSGNPLRKPWIGRTNPVMVAMTSQFSEQELKDIAKYLASLSGDLATLQHDRLH